MHFQNRRPDEPPENAFTFTELLAVLCTIALLALFVLPVLARDADSPERAVCLNNMKRIMAAVAMYSTDNNDFLPHPSWGGDLTGADNWCYATRLPTGQTALTASGNGGPDAYTNQVPFYLAGGLKIVYDLLLFREFRSVAPAEDASPRDGTPPGPSR